jgi:hypothetical protein
VEADLGTTNVLLLVMAVVSVFEALLIIGLAIAGYRAYSRTVRLLEGFEERHLIPLAARANAILDDLRRVSATVRDETDRANHAIHSTIHRVDDTVDKVKGQVRARTSRLVGVIRGLRVALETMLSTSDGSRARERREAPSGGHA